MRWQFHHVIDVAPTILEAAGIPQPDSVNGVAQRPIEGVSMLYSFSDAKAAERHETQYFEMFGNRGIYHKGWTAVTKHKTPWLLIGEKTLPFDDDVWELYDTTKDWSQANDLSKQMPEKLHELQRLWLIEATRYNVLPINDDLAKVLNPDTAGRPQLIKGNTQLLFGGMGHLSENCVVSIKNKSHSVTAEIGHSPPADDSAQRSEARLTGACCLQSARRRPVSLTQPSTCSAKFGQPGQSQIYSVSSSSRPSAPIIPVLTVTEGISSDPVPLLILRTQTGIRK